MFELKKKRWKEQITGRRGQMIVEYGVMFTVIVAVIVVASTTFIKPALNRFFSSTSNIIDDATQTVEDNF